MFRVVLFCLILFYSLQSLAANYFDHPLTQLPKTGCGAKNKKCLKGLYHIPKKARGLVLFLHGRGGSEDFVTKIAAAPYANEAVKFGFGVLSVAAPSGQKWQTKNINKVMETVKYLRKANSALNSKSPLFLIGHSNGGGMASKIAFIYYKEVKGVLLSSAAGIMRFYQELEYATNMPPTRWQCAKNDSVVSWKKCRENFNTFSKWNPKKSQKKWISERPLSYLSFSRVKGIGWLTSLKIVQAYQDSARSCDALDKNNYLRFDPFERESKEAYYDCLLEAKIQLSQEELKDHFDIMEMHYAQHKMSGFKERAIETMRFFEQNL